MNLKIHMMRPGYLALQEKDVVIPLRFLEENEQIRELKEKGFYVTRIDLE